MADLRVADQPCCFGDEGVVFLDQWCGRDVVVTSESADCDRLTRVADVRQLLDATDVDQQGRPRHPQAEERQQRMATRERLRVATTPEERHRLIDRRCNLVVER